MEKNKSPISFRIVSAVLLIGWMGLIFCFSHQNADVSSSLSGGLIEYTIKLFMPNAGSSFIAEVIASVEFWVRKLAHFCIYAVLGTFSFLTLVSYKGIPFVLRCFFSLLISAVYALSDEYHQTFISGRSGELRDVLIDSSGALTGILICVAVYGLIIHIKKKRKHKMNKKQYMELSQDLQERLLIEKNATKELRQENSKLMEENNDLNAQLNELRRRIVELENSIKTAENFQEEDKSDLIETEIEETKFEIADSVEEISETKIPIKEPQLSDGMSAGAQIIGKIVLSSAEYCNALSGVAASPNAKELLNLILGRTEVAKAEILRISALDIPYEEKLKAMETELGEAEDYFKSVMAQKN